ncbi:putative translation initiation factor eIF-2B subunit gamma [Toxocara canis]|uniref:Translation initiation factor eIF2B subunit gamma n=1 Tax=Toxocara canis TaxID=6265 RepID=A0A0B2UXW8_TOXCA|nr:putative translation initiation factor eIF-2B subunit gamma [Toxocara canis]
MGNRMTELTDRIPKCMLPIAGIPMFWYPLNFLRINRIKGKSFDSDQLHYDAEVGYLAMNRGEWQAVLLCGGMGNRMTELTDRIPKCMLPIAGIPMFWYPLNFLRINRIKDVLFVVSDRVLPEVKQLLAGKDLPPLDDDMNIEYIPLASVADEWGTADVLRHIEAKIKRDFIVVSGDFVSDMSLAPLLTVHRSQNSSLTCVLAENVVTGPIPGPKIKRSKGRDFVALSEKNQLLFLGSEEDFDDTIPVNAYLFSKFRNVHLSAKYNDCHVYLMKRWIMDVIKQQRTFSSVKADLIPYLLEKQYTTLDAEMVPHVKPDKFVELANQFSFGTPITAAVPQLRCFAYIVTPENGSIIAHVNNIGAYFEVNKAILRFLTCKFCDSFPPSQKINQNGVATVSESYISKTVRFVDGRTGEGAAVSRTDKPIIKRSVLGAGCEVGLHAKITNSLIMDSCVIGAGAQITNTIVCSGVEIEEGAEITSSIVTNRQKISANANIQNELIVPENEMDIDE